MNHREFQDLVNRYADEIGGNGETIASHELASQVLVQGPDGDLYPVVGVSVHQLGGCGCPIDIVIKANYEGQEN